MKLFPNIKNYLYDNEYFIDITNNYTHIYNYQSLESLSETFISLKFANFIMHIEGENLKVTKVLSNEMQIIGTIVKVCFINA